MVLFDARPQLPILFPLGDTAAQLPVFSGGGRRRGGGRIVHGARMGG